MAVLFVMAGASQIRMQLFTAADTLKKAKDSNRYNVTKTDVAKRGVIVTADGKVLAEDIDNYELSLNFDQIPRTSAFALELSKASAIPAIDFLGIKTGSHSWAETITSSQATAISKVKKEWRAKGVSLKRVSKRNYPYAEVTSSFLGNMKLTPVDIVENGEKKTVEKMVPSGLESTKNGDLEGVNGVQEGLTDKDGALLPLRSKPQITKRADGKKITLTIDSELQKSAAEAVKTAVVSNKAARGVAIVLDPKTGDILALANWPSYDPKDSAAKSAGYNPAYMGGFEPGSTLKVLTLAKALDSSAIPQNWSMICKGKMNVNKKSLVHCEKHHGVSAHGPVTIEKAIAKSCNVSAALWALKIGRPNFMQYMDQLELFKPSKLGLPHEVAGFYNEDEPAKQLQLATFGFGQSMLLTPVSLAGAFGMLANNGIRMQPRIVKQIGDKVIDPIASSQILKPTTCQSVLDCMEAVIEQEEGTGKTLRIPGYRLGGKTGTAQKKGAKNGGNVANFVGMVPSQHPKAIILVMIDDPRNGRIYGADVAGPAFVSIAQAVINRMDIKPTEPIAAKPVTLKSGSDSNKLRHLKQKKSSATLPESDANIDG